MSLQSADSKVLRLAELCDVISVELQPFLLSVLHYIILYRPDNEKGKATFESWFSRTSEELNGNLSIPASEIP